MGQLDPLDWRRCTKPLPISAWSGDTLPTVWPICTILRGSKVPWSRSKWQSLTTVMKFWECSRETLDTYPSHAINPRYAMHLKAPKRLILGAEVWFGLIRTSTKLHGLDNCCWRDIISKRTDGNHVNSHNVQFIFLLESDVLLLFCVSSSPIQKGI